MKSVSKEQFCQPSCYISSRITKDANDCWIWNGFANKRGYRFATYHNVQEFAHRFCYKHLVGAFPEHLSVCHTCDNPPCVNPAHLFVGNTTANIRDMDLKGRRVTHPGIANPQHRLTEAQVLDIYHSPMSGIRLSKLYPVSINTIHRIKRGERWSSVTGHVDTSRYDPNSHKYGHAPPPIIFRHENPKGDIAPLPYEPPRAEPD